ncbi:MAG: hypothetical protein ACLQMO_01415, partial [Acidobacteriaceae bacterium]
NTKVSYGFSKIAGPFEQFTFTDLYYGPSGSKHGKIGSMLAISNSTMNIIYAVKDLQDAGGGNSTNSVILSSSTKGLSWITNSGAIFNHIAGFNGGFVQFGENYSGNTDGYVYFCGGFWNNPTAFSPTTNTTLEILILWKNFLD